MVSERDSVPGRDPWPNLEDLVQYYWKHSRTLSARLLRQSVEASLKKI